MGTIKDFEDLEIWKMAREMVNLVYSDFRRLFFHFGPCILK
jgi:hypothetical protein